MSASRVVSSASVQTFPCGLPGVQTTTAFVRGVRAASSASKSTPQSGAVSGTYTGRTPSRLSRPAWYP